MFSIQAALVRTIEATFWFTQRSAVKLSFCATLLYSFAAAQCATYRSPIDSSFDATERSTNRVALTTTINATICYTDYESVFSAIHST
jgi:hypothetical protein